MEPLGILTLSLIAGTGGYVAGESVGLVKRLLVRRMASKGIEALRTETLERLNERVDNLHKKLMVQEERFAGIVSRLNAEIGSLNQEAEKQSDRLDSAVVELDGGLRQLGEDVQLMGKNLWKSRDGLAGDLTALSTRLDETIAAISGDTQELNRLLTDVSIKVDSGEQFIDDAVVKLNDLRTEVEGIKTFVVQTAEAAAAQRQQETARLQAVSDASLRQHTAAIEEMMSVRQQIIDELVPLIVESRERQANTLELQQRERPSFDPDRLLSLQREFVARQRRAQGEEWAGPKPTALDQPQAGL